GRVHPLVEREVRGDLADPQARVTVVEDLRLARDTVGEDDLLVPELQGVQQPRPRVADPRARRDLTRRERRVDLAARGVVGVVELPVPAPLGSTHDRVRRGVLAEVDARLVVTELAARGDVPLV